MPNFGVRVVVNLWTFCLHIVELLWSEITENIFNYQIFS